MGQSNHGSDRDISFLGAYFTVASAEQKENLLTSEMTLRSALQFLNVPGEVIRKADEILSEIPNLTVSDARCKCTPPAAPGSSNRNSLDFIL